MAWVLVWMMTYKYKLKRPEETSSPSIFDIYILFCHWLTREIAFYWSDPSIDSHIDLNSEGERCLHDY